MFNLRKKIEDATNWAAYVRVYGSIYRSIILDRWALGSLLFSDTLHHTTVPDVTGHFGGHVNWAAYSQPSSESLEAAALSISESFLRSPKNFETHRYLFFVPHGATPSRVAFLEAIHPELPPIDLWIGSIENSLSSTILSGVLESNNVLFAEDRPIVSQADCDNVASAQKASQLFSIADDLASRPQPSTSTIPSFLYAPTFFSSVILAGLLLEIPNTEILGEGLCKFPLSPRIALKRASDSRWEGNIINSCRELVHASPIPYREYIVSPGDTLTRIVRKEYGISFARIWPFIKEINPTISNPDKIRANQPIRLPSITTVQNSFSAEKCLSCPL